MKDNELIKTIVKTFIIENKFKFKVADIRSLLKDAIDVKINKVKEEHYDNVRILYIYFGTKKKRCLTFTINDENIRIDEIL